MPVAHEKPDVQRYDVDVASWDRDAKKWKFGKLNTADLVDDVVEIVWTATGVNTDVVPDVDTHIDVLYAKRIYIQCDTTDESNTSSDIDINVESAPDLTHWDTEPYATINLGDAQLKTMLVEPGARYIRLRADNNEAATEGYIKARVLVIR